jgi:predicted nucleic acid-binding protein
VVSKAEVLIDQFAISEGLRPADALQLASALEAHAHSPLDALLTTDQVLSRCAVKSGLVVKP